MSELIPSSVQDRAMCFTASLHCDWSRMVYWLIIMKLLPQFISGFD